MAAKKETINVTTHPLLAKRFREVAAVYDHRIGLCLTAAMVLFMAASPEEQGEALKKVFDAELRDQVAEMLDRIKAEQAKKVQDRGSKKDRL